MREQPSLAIRLGQSRQEDKRFLLGNGSTLGQSDEVQALDNDVLVTRKQRWATMKPRRQKAGEQYWWSLKYLQYFYSRLTLKTHLATYP